jgi:hypothetical protein
MTDHRDVIADLIRAAGRRPDPPAADRDAVLRAASDAWRQAVRRRQRHQIAWGLAASVLCVAVILQIVGTRPAQPDLSAQLGVVESLQGEIAVRDTGSRRANPRPASGGGTHRAGRRFDSSAACNAAGGSGPCAPAPGDGHGLRRCRRERLGAGPRDRDVVWRGPRHRHGVRAYRRC